MHLYNGGSPLRAQRAYATEERSVLMTAASQEISPANRFAGALIRRERLGRGQSLKGLARGIHHLTLHLNFGAHLVHRGGRTLIARGPCGCADSQQPHGQA